MPLAVMARDAEYNIVALNGPNAGQVIDTCATMAAAEDRMAVLQDTALGDAKRSLEEGVKQANPVILGIAATNRPHLPLPPMGVVNDGDEDIVRVPFLREGTFRHPQGDLAFNEAVFDKMLRNHENGLSHYGVSLDVKHKPEIGALAWFGGIKGGRIAKEKIDGILYLVGYGKPVSEAALDIVRSGAYMYASAEFVPDYHSNVVSALSADDMRELTEIELQEEQMKFEIKPKDGKFDVVDEDGKVVASGLATEEAAMAKIKALNAKAEPTKAEESKGSVMLEDYESLKTMLDESRAEAAVLRRRAISAEVKSTLDSAKSRRDDKGRAVSPFILEWAENVLNGKPVVEGDEAIKLEEGSGIGTVVRYTHYAVKYLLENIPCQVPVESHTSGDEKRLEDKGESYSETDFATFWA